MRLLMHGGYLLDVYKRQEKAVPGGKYYEIPGASFEPGNDGGVEKRTAAYPYENGI